MADLIPIAPTTQLVSQPKTQHFVVSARKYRPATWGMVVGQDHITVTLRNAIAQNHVAQAFLFCGPRGVGKTTCARILAKTINCTNRTADTEPCNACESCTSFNQGASFNISELDAASNNSVEDVRALVEQVRYPPVGGRYKVYIVDEVHMLSVAAFNAFLKTLEEPPSYAIFILATTEKHKILPTILSRCQIFDFNRIKVADIVLQLQRVADSEKIIAEPEALHIIAQKADGGMRDALSMFDLVSTFAQDRGVSRQGAVEHLNVLDYEYYFRITDSLFRADASAAMLLFDEILSKGFDGHLFLGGLAGHMRNLLMSRSPETVRLLQVPETAMARFLDQARAIPAGYLMTALNLAAMADGQYKNTKNQRLLVELTLMKMCYLQQAIDLATATRNGTTLPAPSAPPAAPPAGEKKNDPSLTAEPPLPYQPQLVASGIAPAAAIQPSAAGPRATLSLAGPPPRGPLVATPATTDEAEAVTHFPDKRSGIITEQSLSQAITLLVEKAQAEGNVQLAGLLKLSSAEYDGEAVVFTTAGTLQQERLQAQVRILLPSLRDLLGNDLFDVQYRQGKPEVADGAQLYTDADKMKYMLSAYPELVPFQVELGLAVQ